MPDDGVRQIPRFFTHVYNPEALRDAEGKEYPDLSAARTEARLGASELIAEQIARGELVDLSNRLEISDQAGLVVATLSYAEFFIADISLSKTS